MGLLGVGELTAVAQANRDLFFFPNKRPWGGHCLVVQQCQSQFFCDSLASWSKGGCHSLSHQFLIQSKKEEESQRQLYSFINKHTPSFWAQFARHCSHWAIGTCWTRLTKAFPLGYILVEETQYTSRVKRLQVGWRKIKVGKEIESKGWGTVEVCNFIKKIVRGCLSSFLPRK